MSGEITNLSEDVVLHILSFLGHYDLFQSISLVSKQFSKLVGPEYPHWRYIYEDNTLRIENNIPPAKPSSEIKTSNEYRTLFMKRILPILQQKKAFLHKIDKLAQDCDIQAELYAKIKDLLSKSMQLHIGFKGTNLGYQGSVANYPLGTSRYGTRIVDVPIGSVLPNNIVMQLDMSLIKETYCAEQYNLPTTGHLYYVCDQQVPNCFYVPHNNLKRETNNDVDDLGFQLNFVIETAVDILDTIPEEDFPALQDLYNLRYEYTENREPVYGDLETFVEKVRDMRYLRSKDFQTYCNLQMFGTPYYTQDKQDLNGKMLFMYYTSGGDELAYVTISTEDLMRQDFSNVRYDSQY